MLKQLYIILVLAALPLMTAQAQQEPSFAHYWAMETSFNPAAAGKEDVIMWLVPTT